MDGSSETLGCQSQMLGCSFRKPRACSRSRSVWLELVHQFGTEPAQRRHDAALEIRHVVEQPGRREERHHRRPGVDIDLAIDQIGRGGDRLAFAWCNAARRELRIVVDILGHQRADRVVEDEQREDDAPRPLPGGATA